MTEEHEPRPGIYREVPINQLPFHRKIYRRWKYNWRELLWKFGKGDFSNCGMKWKFITHLWENDKFFDKHHIFDYKREIMMIWIGKEWDSSTESEYAIECPHCDVRKHNKKKEKEIKRKAHRCDTLKSDIYSDMMIIPRKRGNRWWWLFKDREDKYNLWIWFCQFCGKRLEKRKIFTAKNKALISIIVVPIVIFGTLIFMIWSNTK